MTIQPIRSSAALLVAASVVACGGKVDEPPAKHEHHAPHHGALEVLGDEFAHVELVLDPETGRLSAYVLDGEAENPVRIAQGSLRIHTTGLAGGDTAVVLNAVANALSGERTGDTSQFEAASERLKGVVSFAGSLETITVRGMKFDAVAIGYPDGNEHKEKRDGAK